MKRVTKLTSIFVLLMLMAGCTAAPMEEAETEEETVLSPVPERLSFTAPTFDRTVDHGAQHDLRPSFDGLLVDHLSLLCFQKVCQISSFHLYIY